MSDEASAAASSDVGGERPPAQSFSPAGTDFSSVEFRQKAARDRLGRLPEHPPFQMFIEEREPNEARVNSVKYAGERAVAAMGHMGHEPFIASYVTWWEEKGHWVGEDPFGRLVGTES